MDYILIDRIIIITCHGFEFGGNFTNQQTAEIPSPNWSNPVPGDGSLKHCPCASFIDKQFSFAHNPTIMIFLHYIILNYEFN